jgi:hypothetical protein
MVIQSGKDNGYFEMGGVVLALHNERWFLELIDNLFC